MQLFEEHRWQEPQSLFAVHSGLMQSPERQILPDPQSLLELHLPLFPDEPLPPDPLVAPPEGVSAAP